MTYPELLAELRRQCDAAGSQAAWARAHSLSPVYVSDVLSGQREPGPAILAAMQLRRIVSYEPEG